MDIKVGADPLPAQEAIGYIKEIDSGLAEIENKLRSMRELAISAAYRVKTDETRAYLDAEFQQLKKEIDAISLRMESKVASMLDGTID